MILITGASMGIGRAMARVWGARGETIVLAARRRPALEETAREVEALGGNAIVIAGDVTDSAHRAELAAVTKDGLAVLVNNAGRGFYAPFESIDPEELRRLFELNVVAPLALTQVLLPALEAKNGTIVMMSSIAGIVAAPKLGGYAATKFALEGISMAMRAELRGRGVRVVVIRPGPVATGFRENASKGAGVTEYDAADPNAQKAEDVARRVVRAVDRGTPVVETSNLVRLADAALRFAPPLLRRSLARMASKP